MGIDGFPSQVIPLNLAEPAYLEHVYSVFIFSLSVCEWNWPLYIGPLQLLNSSLYWSPGTIQSFSYLDQVKQLILAYGSVSDQVTNEFSSFLHNPPHRVWIYIVFRPFNLFWKFNNNHGRCFSLCILVAYYCSPCSRIPYPYILLLILLWKKTMNRLNPSWRQPLFQFFIKLPLILGFMIH